MVEMQTRSSCALCKLLDVVKLGELAAVVATPCSMKA